jgi:hypothetical protein
MSNINTTAGTADTDPQGQCLISAMPVLGGIQVSWTYPDINPTSVKYVELYRSVGDAELPVGQAPYQLVYGTSYYDPIQIQNDQIYYYWVRTIAESGYRGVLSNTAESSVVDLNSVVIGGLTATLDTSSLGNAIRALVPTLVPTHQQYQSVLDKVKSDYTAVTQWANAQAKSEADARALLVAANKALTDGTTAVLKNHTKLVEAYDATIDAVGYVSKTKIGYAAYKGKVLEYGYSDKKYGYFGEDEWVPYNGNGTTRVNEIIIESILSNNVFKNKFNAIEAERKNSPKQLELILKLSAVDQDSYFRIKEYQKDLTLIIDAPGVAAWNSLPYNKTGGPGPKERGIPDPAEPLEWRVGLPVAYSVSKVKIPFSDLTGYDRPLTIINAFEVQNNFNRRMMGQYHLKMIPTADENTPMMHGYGLARFNLLNAEGVFTAPTTFLVNAATFSIGIPTNPSAKADILQAKTDNTKPFIIETTTKTVDSKSIPPGVYLKNSFLANYTFKQLITDDASFEPDAHSSKTLAKTLIVDRLKVNKSNPKSYMEVTGDLITIKENNQIRVKIGKLS